VTCVLVIWFDGRGVAPNILGCDDFADLLEYINVFFWMVKLLLRTRCLNKKRSFCVNVSALAMTGIRLTRVPRRFMISMSSGFRLSFFVVRSREW